MKREYKKLPKSIISPFTGDELLLEPMIDIVEEGRGYRSSFCFADTDGDECFYCDDVVGIYLNAVTREVLYV
mgnify:CR=1 FL=1